MGIEGGYIHDRDDKKRNFEIIADKLFSTGSPTDIRCFGFVQKNDSYPKRRLMAHLSAQGMVPWLHDRRSEWRGVISDGSVNYCPYFFHIFYMVCLE